jgi:hypothetical protein
MAKTTTLPKYSIGVGDRFARQAKAQLAACMQALEAGVEVTPVWNKSNREHLLIGTHPKQTRAAADAAVKSLGWTTPYFVDADHINLNTVERFLDPCDFFTIDVAEQIGKSALPDDVDRFLVRHPELIGTVQISNIAEPFQTDAVFAHATANKFLAAVKEAGKIYRLIADRKGTGTFIPEISMDETGSPQTPVELLILLAAVADEGIPIQTIAPKFTGRFNKGVDYVGDVSQFTKEFTDDLATIAFAVEQYDLPANLKLSIHSGSDKFSIYQPIHGALRKFDAGLHLKTAGTTWLEELIGLAEAGGSGLDIAKEVYRDARAHADELCRPYASVINIDQPRLPDPGSVDQWTSDQFTSALRHDQHNAAYNPSFRQLLHVGFKVAAKLGDHYLDALDANAAIIARNVTTNLYDRHIRPVFLGPQS